MEEKVKKEIERIELEIKKVYNFEISSIQGQARLDYLAKLRFAKNILQNLLIPTNK